jgi:UV DNA damage endonuclease
VSPGRVFRAKEVVVMSGRIRVGYPCINRAIGCTANHTFRLVSYSPERLKDTVARNLECLRRILEFNLDNGILFFRISSDLVPFASHPVCSYDWQRKFAGELAEIGCFIKKNSMRVSMHPDQFVLINALDEKIVKRSVLELEYHCRVLDLMGLDRKAKVQIHVGGVYGDKGAAIQRFTKRYSELSPPVKRRLVIENDDRLYTLGDCLAISKNTKIPVLLDVFHHECLSSGESLREALRKAESTWKKSDGPLMVDYSEQEKGKRKGSHAEGIGIRKFRKFLNILKRSGLDADIMLEIKDKEKSAVKAVNTLHGKI